MRHQKIYLLKEAIRGFKGARLISWTSIFTIGITTSVAGIILIGLSIFLSIANFQADQTGGSATSTIRVFLAQNAEDAKSIKRVKRTLSRVPHLDSCVFVSKKEALTEFQKEFDPEMLEVLPYNPLPPSFILFPDKYYQTADKINRLKEILKSIRGVEEVTGYHAHLVWLDKWKLPLMTLGFFLFLFIGGGLVLIVSNAVKLNLFTRKTLVENMKYCGADEVFITIPFLLEGLILGLAGSVFGVTCTFIAFFLIDMISPGFSIKGKFLIPLILILFTSLMGSWASFRTVRKFIHEDN
ncbi:MAG: hypothetical protein HQK83_00590 [Fibrobacteria bacterium]|nr:hypothetical protein [Fibrobacteria bacterium]